MENDEEILNFPPKPEEPLPSDCCGTGCSICVFDIYEKELKEWEKLCKDIKSGIKIASCTGSDNLRVLSQKAFRPFVISDIKSITADTYIYRFEVPDDMCIGCPTGQHLTMKAKVQDEVITRQYTPISDTSDVGYFDIMIKLYKDGKMSNYIRNFKIGDSVEWKGPFGSFHYAPNSFRLILMLAAGTGIAPMVSLIQFIVNNDKDETFICLMYACRTYSDILLKDKLQEFSSFWNFRVKYFLSQDDGAKQSKYNEKIIQTRITKDHIQGELKDNFVNDTLVLICGTKSFDKDMINFVMQVGVPSEHCFKF